jgi:hypothetical protein
MNRSRLTDHQITLVNELALVSGLLVDSLSNSQGLSALALRDIIEMAVRVAAARKRLGRLRRLRRAGPVAPSVDELARLRLDRLDIDSPFGAEDLKL